MAGIHTIVDGGGLVVIVMVTDMDITGVTAMAIAMDTGMATLPADVQDMSPPTDHQPEKPGQATFIATEPMA